MRLTHRQKDAIRNLPCALCLAVPPFPDGSRCHPHRIVRGKDGGEYTRDNVVPLCPPCHSEVDRLTAIRAAYIGGKRSYQVGLGLLDAETRKENARHGGLVGGPRNKERRRLFGLTEPELRHRRAIRGVGSRAKWSRTTREQRVAFMRRVRASRPNVELACRRFGRLAVLEAAGRRRRDRLWLCRCDCGASVVATTHRLVSGKTPSCGCRRRELLRALALRVNAKMGSAERSARSRKGGLANGDRKRRNGLTPAERNHLREAGRVGTHRRWHAARGIVTPGCTLCAGASA